MLGAAGRLSAGSYFSIFDVSLYLGADLGCARKNFGIFLAQFDPVLKRVADPFRDAAIAQLGDETQLGADAGRSCEPTAA